MMTPEELDAIEARCKAATPEPWTAHEYSYHWYVSQGSSKDLGIGVAMMDGASEYRRENGVFVAHSRTDLPRCVAEIRANQQRIAELEAELAAVREGLAAKDRKVWEYESRLCDKHQFAWGDLTDGFCAVCEAPREAVAEETRGLRAVIQELRSLNVMPGISLGAVQVAVAAERERCAGITEQIGVARSKFESNDNSLYCSVEIAAAIREGLPPSG